MISNFIKITALLFFSFNLWVIQSKQQDTASKPVASKKPFRHRDISLVPDKCVGGGDGISIKGAPGYSLKFSSYGGAGGVSSKKELAEYDDSSSTKYLGSARCCYYFIKTAGTYNYSLNVWWMRQGYPQWVGKEGSVSVGVLLNKKITQEQTMNVQYNDTAWSQHSINFSLTTQIPDTIVIKYSPGHLCCAFGGLQSLTYFFSKIELIMHK
jgi:hypothetical protein